MKYVRQLLIILFVSFLGELLKSIIPLSIPASIYGMVLLFLALELKILKVSDIKETSNFLIEIMPLMFVPAGVGLLDSWGALQPIWIQVVVITLISTVIVMGVSGSITQFVLERTGLLHFFEEIFDSQSIGAQKPYPEFFDHVADAIEGFCKERTLLIGDSINADIRGGRDAGIDTCWFCPTPPAQPPAVAPTYTVHSLYELPALCTSD